MYSLLPKVNDRETVHERYMTPLRNHLNSVRDKLGTLTRRLDVFAAAAARVDGQNFLAALLRGFRDYIVEFLQVARVINAGLEHVIGLLADELIAPGFDYSRHPGTLPAVPESRKRQTIAASLKKVALRQLGASRGRERDRIMRYARRWCEIIRSANHEQLYINIPPEVDAPPTEGDAPMDVDA